MLRAILSVIAGYAAMFILVFVTFSAAYLAMGTDQAFRPDSYDVSALWLIVSFALSIPAAIVGGWLCATISRGGKPPLVLAGFVLVFGLLMVIPVAKANQEPSKPRTAGVGNLEAMNSARQPTWVAVLNAIIGGAGVWVGARLRKPGAVSPATA